MCSLTIILKAFYVGAILTVSGSEFQSLGAERENEPSHNAVLDLGAVKERVSDDLKVLLHVFPIGFCYRFYSRKSCTKEDLFPK